MSKSFWGNRYERIVAFSICLVFVGGLTYVYSLYHPLHNDEARANLLAFLDGIEPGMSEDVVTQRWDAATQDYLRLYRDVSLDGNRALWSVRTPSMLSANDWVLYLQFVDGIMVAARVRIMDDIGAQVDDGRHDKIAEDVPELHYDFVDMNAGVVAN